MIRSQLMREWADLGLQTAPWDASTTLEATRLAVHAHPDETLAQLLDLAHAGEPLAGRVIVQALLPKLTSMARRDGADVGDFVTHLWLQIARYDLARRPRRIAANLTLDTWKNVRKERRPWPAPPPPHIVDEGPRAAEVLEQARARQLVSASTLEVLISVYLRELPHRDVARVHGLSEVAVRQRCSKAVRRLASERDLWLSAA